MIGHNNPPKDRDIEWKSIFVNGPLPPDIWALRSSLSANLNGNLSQSISGFTKNFKKLQKEYAIKKTASYY